MPIATMVAGAYAGTWTPASGSPAALGITRDGYRPTFAIHEERVEQSDQFGRTLIEKFYLGARAGIVATFLEWNANVLKMMNPYYTLVDTGAGKFVVANSSSPIGRTASAVMGALILTVTASTPAAAKPATVTYGGLMPVTDRDMEWTYDSKHRVMTAAFECMLYLSTSDYILYSMT